MGSVPASPFMPQRQNTVDMIGELPDIDFFSIPGEIPRYALFGSLLWLLIIVFSELLWLEHAACVTVDDFYEDYVTELGTRNSRRLSGKSVSSQHDQKVSL